MNYDLRDASTHIDRMVERAGFDGAGLALVSNHSRVEAYRYCDHHYGDGQLSIRFGDAIGNAEPRYQISFSSDDDVQSLYDEIATFYRDGRLVAISRVGRD